MAALKLITTGGTIGADPYRDIENPPERSSFITYGHGDGNLPANYIKKWFQSNLSLCELNPVDSNHIDMIYRRRIWNEVWGTDIENTLTTHGTDTVLETGQYLNTCMRPTKRNILVGSMVPAANGAFSDAFNNMDYALEMLTTGQAPTGTSIVLHGFDAYLQWKPILYRPEEIPYLHKVRAGLHSRLERR